MKNRVPIVLSALAAGGAAFRLEERRRYNATERFAAATLETLLNAIEANSPGTKAAFFAGFLARGLDRFATEAGAPTEALQPCTTCGAPTTGEQCAFCRIVERAAGREPVAVAPPGRRRSRP